MSFMTQNVLVEIQVSLINLQLNSYTPYITSPRGDIKVSMLTHTFSHKFLKKIKVTRCNHQADRPLFVWTDLIICKFRKVRSYMTPNVLTETRRPKHKPNLVLQPDEDGYCPPDKRDVHVLTRKREPLSTELIEVLSQKVRDVCLEPGDFQPVNHESKYNIT